MINLTIRNFDREILSSIKPCVVIFKSEECHLCQEILPAINRLQKIFTEFKFALVDTKAEEDLGEILSINGVPTIFVFSGGDSWEVNYPEDGYTEEYLTNCLENFFKK